MGYDVHITRAADWSDIGPGQDITAEEWLDCVREDAALEISPGDGDYFAVWSGPSRHGQAWFDWSDGCIYTKNPDPPVIQKAVEIAYALRARAQGDDGEVYLPDGQLERDGEIEEDQDWRTW